jgi:hypothetical protein
MRAEAVSAFEYNSCEQNQDSDAAVADSGLPASDPDVVHLETVEVGAPRFGRELERAIESYRMHLPLNTQVMGTGVIQKDYGKLRVSRMSVLYVPVQLKFSW